MKRITIKVEIDIDLKFWALLPAININIHSCGFEFEWLCIGLYIRKQSKKEKQYEFIAKSKLDTDSNKIVINGVAYTQECFRALAEDFLSNNGI